MHALRDTACRALRPLVYLTESGQSTRAAPQEHPCQFFWLKWEGQQEGVNPSNTVAQGCKAAARLAVSGGEDVLGSGHDSPTAASIVATASRGAAVKGQNLSSTLSCAGV